MTIVVSSVTRCAGTGHITVTGTLDGDAQTLQTTAAELALEDVSLRECVIVRLRSAVKEANANTWQKAVNALTGKTFKV